MSERERTNTRDLAYSTWHRTDSLSRYVDRRDAFACSMIDIDGAEYCRRCKTVLALIELQFSKAHPKPATVVTSLAKQAGIRAYSVSCWKDGDEDIAGFHWRMISPDLGPVITGSPEQYATFLVSLRSFHECGVPDVFDPDELEAVR